MGHRPTDDLSARFSYSVVASPLHDAEALAELTAPIVALLGELGGEATDIDTRPRPHLYLAATGGSEHSILDLVARRHTAQPSEPVVLLAHGAHNSLPAAVETLAALQQAGRRGRILYLTGDADTDRGEVDAVVTDLEVVHRFHGARIGLVGGASSWLVASSPTPDVVRSVWGPHVDVVDPERMVELTRSARPADVARFEARFVEGADADRTTVTPVEIGAASAVGTALTDVVERDGFEAVAVRCFDLLTEPGTSGCLALASLNDDGVVAGCEGDLPATLAMMWVRFLLDQPTWIANPSRIDAAANRLTIAHCTVAPSMVEDFALSTHFESGIGVGISGRFAEQPVTLVRLGGAGLDDAWIAEGDIVGAGDDPDLCRTQVTVELHDRAVDELLARPLGNHLVLAAGHHRVRLERWWDLAIAAPA